MVVYGAGNLFAARWPDGTVGRIAVTSDTYAPLIRIPGGYQSFQDVGIGFDSIWIATRETQVQSGSLRTIVRGMVTQYAAVSGQEFVKTAIGRAADALAVDPAGGVWALDQPDETVTRIDPTTGRPTQSISLRHFAYGIAARNGTVVISIQSP